jgi:hypothetical protein
VARSQTDSQKGPAFILPLSVMGPADLQRLKREHEAVDDWMRQEELRKPGEKVKPPKTSRSLDELVGMNGANLQDPASRAKLGRILQKILDHAPLMHISFANEPTSAFMGKILEWLRGNVSPYVLVQVGLQPSIAGGCVIRSGSKYYDFSLRQHLAEHRGDLLKTLNDMAANDNPASVTQPEGAQ